MMGSFQQRRSKRVRVGSLDIVYLAQVAGIYIRPPGRSFCSQICRVVFLWPCYVFVLLCFVFIFSLSLKKPRPFVQSFLEIMQNADCQTQLPSNNCLRVLFGFSFSFSFFGDVHFSVHFVSS